MDIFPCSIVLAVLLTAGVLITVGEGAAFCTPEAHKLEATSSYFKKADAYEVTWLRHVNSPTKLSQGLSGEAMMLAGDVSLRNDEPVMLLQSEVYSNLTLKMFLQQTLNSSKGIKLNFPLSNVILPALKVLQNVSTGKANPIWLHAGVLPLTCSSVCTQPIQVTEFVNLCKQYAPNAVLSLGWAVADIASNTTGYSWKETLEMGKLVYGINQPVSIQVHGNLVKKPLEQIDHWLLDYIFPKNISLTVWLSENDTLNKDDLVELRKMTLLQKDRVYYDFPTAQANTFKAAIKGAEPNQQNNDVYNWKSYSVLDCKDVLVGQRMVMFSGDGGWVSSTNEFSAKGMESRHFFIEVMFIRLATLNPQQNFTVIIGSHGLSSSNAVVGPATGLAMTLHGTGRFSVTGTDGNTLHSNQDITDSKRQYTISMYYHAEPKYVQFSVASKDNYMSNKELKFEGELKFSKHHVVMGSIGTKEGAIQATFSTAIALPSGSGCEKSLAGVAAFVSMAMVLLLALII